MNKNLIAILFLILLTACAIGEHKINGTTLVIDDEDKYVLDKNGNPSLNSDGLPILKDKEYELDTVKNISRAKLLFGNPEIEFNCKNGGKALKYTVQSSGNRFFSSIRFFASGNTYEDGFWLSNGQDTLIILFDRNGNYVAQNKKALDQCNL